MSKTVKNLLTESYKRRFGQIGEAALVGIRGLASNDNNAFRMGLSKKQIHVTVVKNSLAKRALKDSKLSALDTLIDGPSALVYGGESVVNVARELIDWAKKNEKIAIKGAILDGVIFTADQVEALSKYPTRKESQAQLVTLLVSPGRKLASSIAAPAAKIAALVKAIEEKLEKGEAIAKVA